MTGNEPTYEDTLFQEDRDKRRHAEVMAETARRAAGDRRDDNKPIWLGVAVVTVIVAVTGALWIGVDHQNASDRRMEQIRQETAQHCIDAHDIWINGNCVPASKP